MLKQQQKESVELENRVRSRKESLEAAVNKNEKSIRKESRKKTRHFMEQHAKVLRSFDAKTHRLGIKNAAAVGTSGRLFSAGGGGSPGFRGGSSSSTSKQRPSDWRHSRAEFFPSCILLFPNCFIYPAPQHVRCAFQDTVPPYP
ncbi:Thousand and one amino acid protein kinase [Fasciola gigantica]|uniref:Thousand and one amino acid protein kinase n=1 Tax=Fasciola gigantica TaxID=46835 RepID=A0A504YUE8_FASGI|nr:Thousand and one amino acid protein kinase [Fasciola gigantica]